MNYVIDTGIISRSFFEPDILKELSKIKIENRFISIITFIELNNWISNNFNLTLKQRKSIKDNINKIKILHVNEKISQLALSFSRSNITDKPNDLLIASTCKYYKYKIITLNKKDFLKYNILK